MYDALDIARYCVEYCIKIGRPISNLQLQKILYYIQAQFLVSRGEPCFYEDILAWQYGPVVKEVYRSFSLFSSSPLGTEELPYLPEILDERLMVESDYFEHENARLIDILCHELSKKSAGQLVNMTHVESPWKDTYADGWGKDEVITSGLIEEYFIKKIQTRRPKTNE